MGHAQEARWHPALAEPKFGISHRIRDAGLEIWTKHSNDFRGRRAPRARRANAARNLDGQDFTARIQVAGFISVMIADSHGGARCRGILGKRNQPLMVLELEPVSVIHG